MDSSRSISANASRRRVAYFYTPEIGDYSYGPGHPMKPDRLRQTHDLIESYAVDFSMDVCTPFPVGVDEMREFHSSDYVEFLKGCTKEAARDPANSQLLRKFNLTEDCPVLEGVFEYCQASVGGSIGSAVKLNNGTADIAINWAGGFHHAKKSKASGFSYVNDVVLGILELLKVHKRVLYVNIDIHHADVVEEAFYDTDRVMTVSFHQFGVFPGTGHIKDIGAGTGKNYALNVPFSEGLNDDHLHNMFRPIIGKAMEVYQPEVVVLQSGASSLAGDRMGCFNLSVKGHADCLVFLRSFNVPLMVLGGGGYTIKNVARCWSYETAVAVGVERDFEDSDLTLDVKRSLFNNLNTDDDLEKIRSVLLAQLSEIEHAPSVPFHQTPSTAKVPEEDEPEMDLRPKRLWNSVAFYDSDAGDGDVHEDEDDDDDSGGDEGKLKGENGDKDEDGGKSSSDEDAAGNKNRIEDLKDEDCDEGESSAGSTGDYNDDYIDHEAYDAYYLDDIYNDSDSSGKSSSSGESSSSSSESPSDSDSSSGSDDYTRNYNKSSSDEDENRYDEPIYYNDDD